MKIIKQCNSFSIRVIEELDNGWNFYPKEENFSPIFIGKNQYVGKKLPKPKFWWQKNKLKICYINDFIILAKFNGTTLFEVKENQYPQKIKEALIYEQSNSQSYIKYCRLRDNKVKKELEKYLAKIAINTNLEKEISQLPICFRAYLQLHLSISDN
ncbi:MAG: hypothetical protein IJW75_00705, partial [Alphaproteobacteria bacterium]|nr:hypothetical protein [Alphaproteobacteria bacterium]